MLNSGSTPIYQAPFYQGLSPSHIYKQELEAEKAKEAPKPKKLVQKQEITQSEYKNLSDEEKNLSAAGVVLSANYQRFLKPWLESYSNPVRRKITSDEDYYQLQNDNAIAVFVDNFIKDLESKAHRSPAYNHMPVKKTRKKKNVEEEIE